MDYTVFNKGFFAGYKEIKWYDDGGYIQRGYLEWFNETGVIRVNMKVNAEITLATGGTRGQYEGYKVSIINRETGLITSKTFYFDDYMKYEGTDKREKGFKIIEHCLKGKLTSSEDFWYINVPKRSQVESMSEKIINYIRLYK